jgi:uncharacterized protein (TIGR02270 family)
VTFGPCLPPPPQATIGGVSLQRPIIPAIVSQHVEDAAHLRSVRSVLVRAPHVKLLQLGRGDERLLAHLDGVTVAGDAGYRLAQEALETPGVGQLFVVAVAAIERRDTAQIERLLALLEALPDAPRALASAFGWVSAPALRGLTAPLLASAAPAHRWLGIAACALHRVDPGGALVAAIGQPQPRLRALALRTAGLLGRQDLLGPCLGLLADEDAACQLAAAWAAVLLGDRTDGARALLALALQPGSAQREALQLALLSADPGTARRIVRQLAAQGTDLRTTLQASAWAGDVQAIPWLIKQMADERHARVAGESFSFLTGADLALLDLERKPPEGFQSGPSDDPLDDNVALDEDESLPWPDVARVQAWWQAHAAGMPQGERCFVGAAADAAHCAQVLATATQRQRRAAALLLSLQRPGAVLFNVAAPTHRQRRLLAGGAALS